MARVSMPSSLITSSRIRKATGWPHPAHRWCSAASCSGAMKEPSLVAAISGGASVGTTVMSGSLLDALENAVADGRHVEQRSLPHAALVAAHASDEIDLLAVRDAQPDVVQ